MADIKLKSGWKIFLLVIIVLSMSYFVIRPAVLGYSVYQDLRNTNASVEQYGQSLTDLNKQLSIIQANASSYAAFTSELLNKINQISNDASQISAENAQLKTKLDANTQLSNQKIKELEEKIQQKEDEADQLEQEQAAAIQTLEAKQEQELRATRGQLTSMQQQYDSLTSQTARSICCKEKVDDSSINSYEIVNNRILCMDDGNRTLSC